MKVLLWAAIVVGLCGCGEDPRAVKYCNARGLLAQNITTTEFGSMQVICVAPPKGAIVVAADSLHGRTR